MKYAVIAAGEGSRLAAEGVAVPKPLVKVAGECLMDHLIRIFMENDAYIKCKDPNKEEEGQNEYDWIELEKIQKKGKAQRADGEEC